MNPESDYYDYSSLRQLISQLYELSMLVQMEKQKERFFGKPTQATRNYHEPVRAVNRKARSTIRQHGNRRRNAD